MFFTKLSRMRWPQTPQLRHAVLLPSRRCVPGSCERRGLHEVAQILVGELVRPSPCSIPDAEKVRQLLHPVLHQAPGQVVSELGECAVAIEVEAIGGEEFSAHWHDVGRTENVVGHAYDSKEAIFILGHIYHCCGIHRECFTSIDPSQELGFYIIIFILHSTSSRWPDSFSPQTQGQIRATSFGDAVFVFCYESLGFWLFFWYGPC